MNRKPQTETKKVAIILWDFTMGGITTFAANLARGLCDLGVEVDLVLLNKHGLLETIPEGVRVYDLQVPKFSTGEIRQFAGIAHMFAAIPRIMKYLREERPSILLTATARVSTAVIAARDFVGIRVPLFVGVHSLLPPGFLSYTMYNLLTWWSLCRADRIVVVAQHLRQWAARMAWPSSGKRKVQVVYNPSISKTMKKRAEEPIDHPWFAPGAPPVALSVGRLVPEKGVDVLIRAFAHVKSDTRLMIMGDGPERTRLEKMVSELNLQHKVIFLGTLANPYPYFARATMFVFAANPVLNLEAVSLVLLEALYLGCRVVTSNFRGVDELIKNSRLGIVIRKYTPEEFARTIDECIIAPKPTVRSRDISDFTVENSSMNYYRLFFGDEGIQHTPT